MVHELHQGAYQDPRTDPLRISLLDRPLRERSLAADDVPKARSRWRSYAADVTQRPPDPRARGIDLRAQRVAVGRGVVSDQGRGVHRREPGGIEGRGESVARLALVAVDLAATLHDEEQSECVIGTRRSTLLVGDRPLEALHSTPGESLKGR